MYNYDDVEAAPSELAQIAETAHQLAIAERRLSRLETELSDAKADVRRLAEQELPDLMLGAGLSELTLADGRKFIIEEKVHTSITKANNSAAMDWLRNSGNDGLIKREVSFRLGREFTWDEVKQLASIGLRETGVDADITEKVEPSTLRAFVKRQLEAGSDIPEDLFSIYKQRIAKVKK